MFFEILIAISCGILAGIITGLTPGVHVNLVALLLVSSAVLLTSWFSPLAIAFIIIATATTHTFLDTIPSVFLGAPDSATALGVLPGHRYLLKGFGLMAVKLTVIGSFFGLLFSLVLFPFFSFIASWIYPLLRDVMGWVLLAIAFFMIFRDRKRMWAFLIFIASGLLGLLTFALPTLKHPLFPLLGGLFGLATLLYSIKEKNTIPEQKILNHTQLDKKTTAKALASGIFSGWLTSLLPGIGAATAAILSLQITKKLGDHGFMILIGAISTVNFSLSLVTLYVLSKARNGALIAVQELLPHIGLTEIVSFASVALIAGSLGVPLALFFGKRFAKLITKLNYVFLVLGVVLFIIVLTLFLSGWLGILVLTIATAIGLLPAIKKVTRIQAMGCILVPVMLYFLI